LNDNEIQHLVKEIREATGMSLGQYIFYKYSGVEKDKKKPQKNKIQIKREKILNEKIEKRKRELEEAGVSGKEVSKEIFKIIQEEKNKSDEEFRYKKIKDLLREGLSDEDISDVLSINSIIPQNQIKMPQKIKNHAQFLEHIRKQDLRFYFSPLSKWEVNKFYDCVLIEGNFAWISMDEDGSYRYFSKAKNGATTGLDWFDLIMIIEDLDIAGARMKLSDDLNLTYKERKWEMKMQMKYVNNIIKIERAYDNWEERYPNLYQFSKNYLYILEKLNAWGLAHITTDKESVKGESVFFVSTTHIADSIKANLIKADQPMVSRAINMFAILGFINKINPDEVPEHLFKIAKELRGDRLEFKYITFYSLPIINSKTLAKAERIAKKLEKNKITNMQQISKKKIIEIFGQDFADTIYSIQPTLNNGEKKQYIKQRQELEHDFSDIPF